MDSVYHVVQINIARMLVPLQEPSMADFVNNLDRINKLAEAAPGYVWRLTTPAGDTTMLDYFSDPFVIVNMSVWANIDALYQFTYYTAHADIYRRRAEWFSKLETPHMALWYTPSTAHYGLSLIGEAKARLEHMALHGPTPYAFTFKQRFTCRICLPTANLSTPPTPNPDFLGVFRVYKPVKYDIMFGIAHTGVN